MSWHSRSSVVSLPFLPTLVLEESFDFSLWLLGQFELSDPNELPVQVEDGLEPAYSFKFGLGLGLEDLWSFLGEGLLSLPSSSNKFGRHPGVV